MKQFILCALTLLVVSCGSSTATSGSSSSATSQTNQADEKVVLPVNLSYVTNVPAINGSSQGISILATNNLTQSLHLSSFTVSDGNKILDSKSLGIDASQCATLVANSVCNIILSSQGFAGNSAQQYIIKTIFNDGNGNSFTAVQEINYQSNSQPANGIYVSRNAINVSVPAGNRSSVVIPFILAQNFNSVSVTSSVPLGSISTVCSNGYKKGNACLATLQLMGNNGMYQSEVKINGILSNNQQVTTILPMTVSPNQVANIITSANVFIQQQESTNDTGSTQVTLYNSGLASASNITIKPQDSGIAIGNNAGGPLPTTLAAGAFCTLVLTSNASHNISTSVIVTYSTAGQSDTTNTVFSVNYYTSMAVTTPQLDATSDSLNAFMNVPMNPSQAYGPLTITYTNSGSGGIPVTNLQVPNGLTQLDSALTIDSNSNNACKNGETLDAGESCAVSFYYNPKSAATAWTRPFAILGQYIPSTESTVMLTVTAESTMISVAPVTQVANISFTQILPSVIRADGESITTFSITATNVGDISATNVKFSYPVVTGVSQKSSTCSSDTLAAGESCTVDYQFGPVKTNINSSPVIESVSYSPAPNGPYSIPVSATENVQLNAATAALVIVQKVKPYGSSGCDINTNPGWGCYSGTGTESDPLYFSNIGQPQSQITITYQNIGTESAESFNVALGDLPLGVMVSSNSTCGNGSAGNKGGLTSVVNINGTCTIILNAVANYDVGSNPLKYQVVPGDLTLNVPMPEVSYNDNSTGVNQVTPLWESSPTGMYMVAQNLTQLNVTNVTLGLESATASYVTTITLHNGGGYAINWIGNWNAKSMNVSSTPAGTCTSGVSVGGSCTVSFTSPAGMLMPGYTYFLSYSYTVTGYDGNYLPGGISVALPSQLSN